MHMVKTAAWITIAIVVGVSGLGVAATYFPEQFAARSPLVDPRLQCFASLSQGVTVSARAENGVSYTAPPAAGLYRIEVVGGSWANHHGNKKIARIHGTSFLVYKNSSVQFGPDGRPRNPALRFSSLHLDPPHTDSERRVAEAAYGLDQTIQLASTDRLVFVVAGNKGKFGEYQGDIKVRICPVNTSTTATPRPTNRPTPTPTPTRQLMPGFGWR